jgi:hypothetical protein
LEMYESVFELNLTISVEMDVNVQSLLRWK